MVCSYRKNSLMSVFICVCIAVFLINSSAVADISHDLVDAAASSHYGDWTPSKVIDGDNGWGSCWSSALHGSSYYTEYIVVKIGNTSSGVNHSITQVSLKPRPDGKSFPRNRSTRKVMTRKAFLITGPKFWCNKTLPPFFKS